MKIIFKKDIQLISKIIDVLAYKLWDNKEGDKRAEEIIEHFHEQEGNYGFMAMAIDLNNRLNPKVKNELR